MGACRSPSGRGSHADPSLAPSTRRTIIIWSLSGERIIDLYGHASFVYDLTVLPPTTPGGGPELASVSEDRTLRIWSGTSSAL